MVFSNSPMKHKDVGRYLHHMLTLPSIGKEDVCKKKKQNQVKLQNNLILHLQFCYRL